MSDDTPKLVHDAEPSPLTDREIVWAMQSRLEKLFFTNASDLKY